MQLRLRSLRQANPTNIPPNNARPNSGLREGGVSHAAVNAAIAKAHKTVIFGQQNRLRNGILMGDERLPRFHAGHELVRFFYNGLNKLPPYLLDAFLDSDISVTLVTAGPRSETDDPATRAAGGDLIYYRDVRCHQAFHIGYTRRTLYFPEGVLREAIRKGYDSWAVAETIIREAFPLLDYLLILDFIRHSVKRFKTHVTLGSHTVIKRAVGDLNRHLNRDPNDPDAPGIGEGDESEFGAFYRHYCPAFLKLTRKILDRDPYEVADAIFDEKQERAWSDVKVNQIATTFDYPTFFDLDRDIVHPAAFRAADLLGQKTEPETADDFIHDLRDAAKFRVLRQTRSNRLLDGLLQIGGPGIHALATAIGEERATGNLQIAEYQNDNYDVATEFKNRLWALSSTGQEGSPGSICNDFRDLLQLKTKAGAKKWLDHFSSLPPPEQSDSFGALKKVAERVVGFLNMGDVDAQAYAASTVQRAKNAKTLLDFASKAIRGLDPDRERQLLLDILGKLNKHPDYHTTIQAQAQELAHTTGPLFGENVRQGVAGAFDLVPERSYTKSSDPQGVRARLFQYEQIKRKNPDSADLYPLLAGILIRLDLAGNYDRLIDAAETLGFRIRPELEATVDKLNPNDPGKKHIIETARDLLGRLQGSDV